MKIDVYSRVGDHTDALLRAVAQLDRELETDDQTIAEMVESILDDIDKAAVTARTLVRKVKK